MKKQYRDIESGKIVTVDQLRQEFAARLMAEDAEEWEEMSFAEYLRNSLTVNNGTLEEVPMRKFRVTVTQTLHVEMEVEVDAYTEEEALEEFDRANADGDYWEQWDDAYTFGDAEDEHIDIEEVEG